MRKVYERIIPAEEIAIDKMIKQANPEELKLIEAYLEELGLRKRAEGKGEY